jgi:hypothetical protein
MDGGEWSTSRHCRCTPGERASCTHWIGSRVGPRAGLNDIYIYIYIFIIIIPVYLQAVQVHSVNRFKEVDECLGEGRSLALFYN